MENVVHDYYAHLIMIAVAFVRLAQCEHADRLTLIEHFLSISIVRKHVDRIFIASHNLC